MVVEIVESLRFNQHLKSLQIDKSGLRCTEVIKMAEIFKINNSLSKIYLISSLIGNDGAGALADTLKYNTSIEQLILHDNNIENEGLMTLIDSLKSNSTLLFLDVGCNKISLDSLSPTMYTILQVLKYNNYSLSRLRLDENQIFGPVNSMLDILFHNKRAHKSIVKILYSQFPIIDPLDLLFYASQ